MILCLGCSWTQHWPKYLPGAEWKAFDGSGLWAFEDAVRETAADLVVIQLPTPIRSYRRGSGWAGKTRDLFLKFYTASVPWRDDLLIDRYRGEILKLNSLHPNVLFFEFNTGGYPFRSPYDFGAECSDAMAKWAEENDLQWLRLDLSGVPGMCVKEGVPGSLRHHDEPRGWSVIEPDGVGIIDAHPGKAAQQEAAVAVQRWVSDKGPA